LFKVVGLSEESDTWINALVTMPLSTLFLFFLYGPMIIAGFYAVVFVLDIIGFGFTKANVLRVLLLEWLIISSPFVYWAFKYDYWLWLTLSLSFLATQLFRKLKIEIFLETS